jgi:hypothetical protein
MDLFIGFLWVIELTIIFISVLLLFYLNYSGSSKHSSKKTHTYLYGGFFGLFFLNYDFPGEFEGYLPVELNIFELWEDYYEAMHNTAMNDFGGLLVGYYSINSLEFILVGVLLLIGSVACVNLFRNTRLSNVVQYNTFFKLFNFFTDFIDYIFMRKQNLTKQTKMKGSTKIFKKK